MFLADSKSVVNCVIDETTSIISSIQLPAIAPWFMCEVSEFDGSNEIVFRTTHLLPNFEQLKQFANSNSISKAYLLSPPYLNDENEWKIDRIRTILKADDFSRGGNNLLFRSETYDGKIIDIDIGGLNDDSHKVEFESFLEFD